MTTVTLDEVLTLFKATDHKFQETDHKFQETDRKFQETDRKFQETDRKFKESDREFQEMRREIREENRETNKMIKALGQQIGGLGDKFGYFTEGMALPSMERILSEQFRMTTVMPRVRTRKGGENIEIDVLAYANGEINSAIIVEVKSRVKAEAVAQLRTILEAFRDFFPEHKDKSLMGILAGVDWDRGVEDEAHDAGFLTASIHDEIFQLTAPEGFRARRW
jgi:hypothetical protein